MCWVDSGFDMDAECVVLHIGSAGSRREWGVENARVMGSARCGWTPPLCPCGHSVDNVFTIIKPYSGTLADKKYCPWVKKIYPAAAPIIN